MLQAGQPPPFLMKLGPLLICHKLLNLLLRAGNLLFQVVLPYLLLFTHRRHLAVQRHPHGVEHPRRYPESLQVRALQRRSRPARRHLGEQLPLHAAIKLGIGRQGGIASQAVHTGVNRDAGLVRSDHQPSRAAASALSARRFAERRP